MAVLLMVGCRDLPPVPGACWAAAVTAHGTVIDPVATVTCDKASATVGDTVTITVSLSVPATETADCAAAVATVSLAAGLSPLSAIGDKGTITCTAPTMTSNGNPVPVTLQGTLPVIAVTLAVPAPSGNTHTIPCGTLVRGGPAATIQIKAKVL